MSSSSTSITSHSSQSRSSGSISSDGSSGRGRRSSSSYSSSSNSSDDDKQNVSFTLTDSSSETPPDKQEAGEQEVEQQVVSGQQIQVENQSFQGWYKVFDVQSELWYFYNLETAQSCWQLPEDVSPTSVLEYPQQEELLNNSSLERIETDQGQEQQLQGDDICEEQFTNVQENNTQQEDSTQQEIQQKDNKQSEGKEEGKKISEDATENQQGQDLQDKDGNKDINEKVVSVEDNHIEAAYAAGLRQQYELQQYHHRLQHQQHVVYESQYSHAPGWYYYDFQQNVQGPFTTEQLRMWRQQLPMDLQLWYYDPSKHEDEEFICVHVYELFGDKNVYEHWQKATQGSAQGPAPTAPQWEEFMKIEQDDSGGGYAAAVRAGLPAQDSAVQAHQLQQYVQHQIPDAMNFYYWAQNYYTAPGNAQYAQYAANAVKDRSGRIIAAETLPESMTGLYSE
eukprot:TRINITY_DN5063_c0_g1_i4.p1 TRINITY_DN5063_c0_g1~~TRINITY_DN5063_c0_g1_i4.p1  ORF type:complete len:462 (-),score=84.47 TRINITY_DN5063_c0_g1_i4:552-1904(-)